MNITIEAQSASGKVKLKDPDSVLSYVHNWSDWLTSPEVISTSTWTVSPSGGLTIDSESETSPTATVWVSAGNVGEVYVLTNQIVTDASPARTCDRTITVRVEER